jgi:uracil-DNA glycosylase
MGVPREVFYDPRRIAIVPMGLCFPGTGASGDLPPRPECAATWHASLLSRLTQLQLTLVVGQHARAHRDGKARLSLADAVRGWPEQLPQRLTLPHPSPRNRLWLRRNPWFEAELVPVLRARVAEALG